jgi:Icc-related predicted phosphoesterase
MKVFLEENQEIDLIICAGDIVNMGEPLGFMQKFIEVIDGLDRALCWVPGNNDFGRAYYKLSAKYPSLEGRVVEFLLKTKDHRLKINLTGVGGSPASWAGQYAGQEIVDKKKIANSIFVSHVPPPGVHNYRREDCVSPFTISHSCEGRNLDPRIKSEDFRPSGPRLSDAPLVHICGHIHHTQGVAYLGTTKIVKLAPLESGYYAIMDLENLKVEFGRFMDKKYNFEQE